MLNAITSYANMFYLCVHLATRHNTFISHCCLVCNSYLAMSSWILIPLLQSSLLMNLLLNETEKVNLKTRLLLHNKLHTNCILLIIHNEKVLLFHIFTFIPKKVL